MALKLPIASTKLFRAPIPDQFFFRDSNFNDAQCSRLRSRSRRSQGVRVGKHPNRRIQSMLSSPSDGDRAMGNSDADHSDFVHASVIEAVELKDGSEGFLIKMRDGNNLRCVHNLPRGKYPPDYISYPTMVLKMEDGSDILLPIIVLEMPSELLMAALRNVEMDRPNMYKLVTEMVDKMGYRVKHVRVTKRVRESYFAELCVVKIDDETTFFCFDLRPSDAINIAVRCKVPIQVNKNLAHSDGLKVVEPANLTFGPQFPDISLLSAMDRPDGLPCPESEEFILLRNMLIAAVEERFQDAAHWKDLLKQFRSKEES